MAVDVVGRGAKQTKQPPKKQPTSQTQSPHNQKWFSNRALGESEKSKEVVVVVVVVVLMAADLRIGLGCSMRIQRMHFY